MSPQAAALATDMPADLLDAVRREIREAGVLQVAPEQFHRVEFGRVGRQPGEVPATMRDQPGGDDTMLVGEPAIPDEDDWTAHVATKVLEKPTHLRPANVLPGIERKGEGELSAARRHDQRANPGDLLVRAGPHRQRRGHAAWYPGPAEHRQHHEPRFIEADEMGAEPAKFFLPWPNPRGSTRAPDDRCAPSRAVGVAAG